MDIEIVSHCWHYSRLLTYQLSSLVLYPPKCEVRITVFACADDIRTVGSLEHFSHPDRLDRLRYPPQSNGRPQLSWQLLPPERLCRRAIGRNLAAESTPARIIWFADCDMMFGPGCLDWLSENWPEGNVLGYPHYVGKCTHERGDELIEAVKKPAVMEIDPTDFPPHRQPRAIGGTQIVCGDVARERGYLKDSKRYQRPASRWMRTVDDVVYRKRVLGVGRGTRLEIPNCWRIRHSKYGRKHTGVEL
jgi:hypothetical protein